jgi:hypothetical protein
MSRLVKLSRNGRPCGSRLAFAGSDVSTPIPSITDRPLLFPQSFTRISIIDLYRPITLAGEIRAYHVPSNCQSGLGSPYSPVAVMSTTEENETSVPATYLLVQADSILGLSFVTTFIGSSRVLAVPLNSSSYPPDAGRCVGLSRFRRQPIRLRLHCPESFTRSRYRERMSR